MAKRTKKQEEGKELTDKEIISSIRQKIAKDIGGKKLCDPQDLPTVVEYLLFDVVSL